MSVEAIHSFLVHPAKHEAEAPAIGGTRVSKKSDRLFQMLAGVYSKADQECTIDISFNQSADGSQENACRTQLINYMKTTSISDGRAVAMRLQEVTNNKSGLGLLFLMVGQEGKETKLVLSRFPADSGILAEQTKDILTVEFIERVFMKSATAYKSAVYAGKSFDAHFWKGKAVDKQITSGLAALSHYRINDFLLSDFLTTSASGTRRLAESLRAAAATAPDIGVRTELASAARLARGLNGQLTSISKFATRLGLTPPARRALEATLSDAHLAEETFQFSSEEFDKHIQYRSVELSSGAVLMAKTDTFDQAFSKEDVPGDAHYVRYTAEGAVVDDKLRKGR